MCKDKGGNMASNFEDGLNRLPFVGSNTGRRNYWTVKDTGDECGDFLTGRRHAAALLHFMRRHDSPSLLVHVMDAMAEAVEERSFTRAGFSQEFSEAVRAAPRLCEPNLAFAAANLNLPQDADRARLRLPFVKPRGDGTFDYWAVAPSGNVGIDLARGRYFAGCLAHYVRRTGDCSIPNSVSASMRAKGYYGDLRQVRVAFNTVFAAIAIASKPDSTPHQRTVLSDKGFADSLA